LGLVQKPTGFSRGRFEIGALCGQPGKLKNSPPQNYNGTPEIKGLKRHYGQTKKHGSLVS
jgi:hypothetical protein